MQHPEISIIVPVYNSSQYLEKCIESILNQTFKNFELILVNDGSTDHSGKICDAYATQDHRVRIIHKQNGGVSSARNAGLRLVKGEYICFVDGDDWIFEDMLLNLNQLSKRTKSDITVCSHFREINGSVVYHNKENVILEMNNIEAMKQLFTGKYFRFAVWGKLYKASCFQNIQYPENRRLDDLPTTYKIFANANKVTFTSYPGYVYLLRENSIITSKYNEQKLDVFVSWDEIITYMKEQYPQLATEYISCFVYYTLDHVFSIIDQVENPELRKKYLQYIQKYIRKYYKDIIINQCLSIKYKYLISIINSNVGLFYINSQVKRKVKNLNLGK